MAEEMAVALPAEASDSVDISGLAEAWEGTRDVRNLLRQSGSIIQSEPGKYHPSDGVNGVGVNFVTLAPLMGKLLTGLDDDDRPRIGMVTIPALEQQLLICSFNFFIFYNFICFHSCHPRKSQSHCRSLLILQHYFPKIKFNIPRAENQSFSICSIFGHPLLLQVEKASWTTWPFCWHAQVEGWCMVYQEVMRSCEEEDPAVTVAQEPQLYQPHAHCHGDGWWWWYSRLRPG